MVAELSIHLLLCPFTQSPHFRENFTLFEEDAIENFKEMALKPLAFPGSREISRQPW